MDKVTIKVSRSELKSVLSPSYSRPSSLGGYVTMFLIGTAFGWMLSSLAHL